MTLEEMKAVDVRTVDPATLVDSSTVHIDEKLPRRERIRQYIEQIKNPYCFLSEGVVVKIRFANCEETMEDRLEAYLRNL